MTETVEQLSCQELVELVTDYLEEALPPEDRARFEAHLEPCEGCTTYLDQMRTTIELVGRLTPEHLDPEAEAVLLRAFRDWNSR
ncbi:MAG TPA: zf-HC2 domain-containing protein [Gaiellaceae bacterium]|nr:zf-HC2 domain-containing protein [Gaiellaceae bacterium]